MKVLFIGGTGVISHSCSELCMKKDYDLYLLTRGLSFRQPPAGAKIINCDIRNINEAKAALAKNKFDVIVNWIAYDVDHVSSDFNLFKNKTDQYIFISSASAYQKPVEKLPITESYPLYNPFWEYSRKKIHAENYLLKKLEKNGFPVTIVRPSHTYDHTKIPLHGGYTSIDRMKRGKKIIIHGDGTSVWTLTHHKDFAIGLTGLLGKKESIGECYNITSDDYLTWNKICELIASASDLIPKIIHIPSDFINIFDREWGEGLLGDKAHSKIFDNSKIKSIVPDFKTTIPFSEGVKEIVKWYNADKKRQLVNLEKDRMMDIIIRNYELGITN